MARNRIVINLDPNQPGARKRRGGRGIGKPLLIITIVLLLIVGGLAAGGFFWWRSYQSSPTYALAVLADAAQRDDQKTVDSILDYDKIAKSIAEDFKPGSARSGSPWPTFGEINPLAPLLSTKLRETVQNQAQLEAKRLSAQASGKPFVVIALAIPWLVEIKQGENEATAMANINGERIQLTMQRVGEQWRVTAVKDDNLTKLVADGLAPNSRR